MYGCFRSQLHLARSFEVAEFSAEKYVHSEIESFRLKNSKQ